MKKYILVAVFCLVMQASFAASPVTKEQAVAREATGLVLNKAVREGVITEKEKQRFLQSGIIEEATQTLIDTNFNVAVAVDKAADKAVREGYFRDKQQAKRTLRQAIEQARKSKGFWRKLYNALGI